MSEFMESIEFEHPVDWIFCKFVLKEKRFAPIISFWWRLFSYVSIRTTKKTEYISGLEENGRHYGNECVVNKLLI